MPALPTAACVTGIAADVLPAGAGAAPCCCAQALNSEPQNSTRQNTNQLRLRTKPNLPNAIYQPLGGRRIAERKIFESKIAKKFSTARSMRMMSTCPHALLDLVFHSFYTTRN